MKHRSGWSRRESEPRDRHPRQFGLAGELPSGICPLSTRPRPGSRGTGTRAGRHSPKESGQRVRTPSRVFRHPHRARLSGARAVERLRRLSRRRRQHRRRRVAGAHLRTCAPVRADQRVVVRGQVDSLHGLPWARVSTRHSRLGREPLPPRSRVAARPGILVRQSGAGVSGDHAVRHTGGIRGRQRIRWRSSAAARPVGDGRPLVRPPLAHAWTNSGTRRSAISSGGRTFG